MIGLLTPFRVSNYGTKLQAYAVQECIRSLANDVEIIDFRFSRIRRTPINIIKKAFYNTIAQKYRDVKNAKVYPDYIKEKVLDRKNAIDDFDSHYVLSNAILGLEGIAAIKDKYEIVFCGSDQIWNPVNIGGEIYLLEWVGKSTKKASFAASFGIETLPRILKVKYKKELKKFDHISVREDSGLSILQSLGITDGKLILDPTLIVDSKRWYCLSEESDIHISEKYIFCYFLGDKQCSRDVAERIQKLTGYTIVNLPHFKGFVSSDENFGNKDLYEVTVQDFLKLIRGAEIICTDSFHATAFSVIFNKMFVVCERHGSNTNGSTNGRLKSFLNMISCNDRLCENVEEVETVISSPPQYEFINEILDDKRKESIEFLKETLFKGQRNE